MAATLGMPQRTTGRRPPPRWSWNEKRELAAVLAATDDLNDEEIARRVGVNRRTFADWKIHPAFAERVESLVREANAGALRRWIGRKHRRVEKLQAQAERIEGVFASRAEAATYDPAAPAAAKTGLLYGRTVMSARGDGERVDWLADVPLLREDRATLEQAAKELGQLSDRIEVSGDQITRRYVGVDVEAV